METGLSCDRNREPHDPSLLELDRSRAFGRRTYALNPRSRVGRKDDSKPSSRLPGASRPMDGDPAAHVSRDFLRGAESRIEDRGRRRRIDGTDRAPCARKHRAHAQRATRARSVVRGREPELRATSDLGCQETAKDSGTSKRGSNVAGDRKQFCDLSLGRLPSKGLSQHVDGRCRFGVSPLPRRSRCAGGPRRARAHFLTPATRSIAARRSSAEIVW